MRLRQLVWIPAFLAACLAATASAATLSPAANAGIQWLQTQVQSDGSVANESLSIAAPLQARSETATALGLAGQVPTSLSGAVAADTGTDTESLSRRVIALVQGGQDASIAVQALYANQNADGGFGSLPGDSSDALDTAFALLALHAANDTSATNLSDALLYMVGSVGQDGGYGLPAGGSGSQVYVTAYVLLAYQAYSASYPLTTQIGGARQWLVNQQSGGVYADALSDALASLALAASSKDASAYSGALTALTAGQQADGSWGDDPYITAMAIRALGVGVAQAAANTGSVTGAALDAVSHAPIAGTQIQVAGPTSSGTTSSSSGQFSLGNLVPGTYTVSVAAAGYGGVTLQNIQVDAAATTTLGTLLLSAMPNLAGLSGSLTDANGMPVAGATIMVSGADNASVISASNGSYSFSGLAPGAVTITVSASGYDTINVPVGLAGGLVLNFSPALYPTGTTPSSASLTGSVQDAQIGAPIAGATVALGTTSVQTDSTGRFSLSGLTAGAYTATVSANGYSGAILSGSVADGVNNAGLVLLSLLAPANNMSAVSGTVTDSSTGKPIAGVAVQAQSTTIATITDANGNYQLTGISGTQFAVLFTAPGYLSKSSGVGLAAPGALVLNAALVPAGSTGLAIQSVSVDQPAYDPYTEAEFDADVVNSTGSDQQVILDAKVLDAQGNVVQDIPAIGGNLSTPTSATLQTVPAGGNLMQAFTFYVRNALAGNYRILVQATDANGDVVAEGGSAVTVNALAQIGGGLNLNPPITQANASIPVHVTADISNLGNLQVPAGQLQLTVSVADNSSATSGPSPSVALGAFYSGNGMYGNTKDAQGNIYVVEAYPFNRVIRIAPSGTGTVIVTLPGFIKFNGSNLQIDPVDITNDPSGNLWVLTDLRLLIKIDSSHVVTYIDTGMTTPRRIESDAAGNLYLTGLNGTDSLLVKRTPDGTFTTLFENGLSKPGMIASSPNGYLYVSNFGDNTISRIDGEGVITTFLTGLNAPQGIVTDPAGNLYVANSGDNDVLRVSPTGVRAVYATGFNVPTGLTFDSQGVLYVTNAGDNSVDKVDANGHVSVFAQSAASNPQGVRYDAQGNLYIANANNNTVTEVDAAGSVHVLATGLSNPHQVAPDGAGDLFVTNFNSGAISEISGGSVTTAATGLNQPYGITDDGAGTLYIAEAGANRISAMPAAGGPVQTIANSMLRTPGPMAVAPDGTVVVANSNFIANLPLSGSGQILASTTSQALGLSYDQNGTLYYTLSNTLNKVVNGAAVLVATIPITRAPAIFDGQGGYYLADFNNKRILHFDSTGASTVFLTLNGNPSWLAGDTAGNLYVVVGNLSVFKVTPSAVATQITNAHFVSGIRTLTVDATGRLVVANSTADTVTVAAQDGTTLAFFVVPVPGSAVGLADGTIAVTDINNHGLRVYSTAGVVQHQMWGFSGPHDTLWANNQLYFDDAFGRFYSLIPGTYPRLLGGGTSSYFSFSQNKLFYTSGGTIATFDLATAKNTFYFTMPSGFVGSPNGVDVRSDGALAVTEPTGDEVVLVSAAKQVTKTYTGINQPDAVAVDPISGKVYVAGRFPSQAGVVEMDPAGLTARPVAVLTTAYGVQFDAAGHLDVSGTSAGNGVFQVNLPSGSLMPTRVAITGVNSDVRGFTFNDGQLYTTDYQNQAVRIANDSTLGVYAYGIASPYAVHFGPDGAMYVMDRTSGSLMRFMDGGLNVVFTGLSNPVSFNFDSSGAIYVGDTTADLYKVVNGGQITDLDLKPLLGNLAIYNIGFDAAGDPLLTLSNAGEVVKVLFPQPPTLPTVGQVVYRTTVPAPGFALGDMPRTVDFGTWVPQYGGDYNLTVTSAQGGVAGSLRSSLHVGSYAQGQLNADAVSLPPGDQPLSLGLNLQGLDFTSIAEVQASNISYDVTTNITSVPPSLGVDPDGNLEYMQGGKMVRVAPDGTTTTYSNLGQGQTLYGDLPIDSQGRVFVNAPSKILLYSPETQTSTVYANLGGVVSMAFGSAGMLYAQVGQQIYAVAPDGSFRLFYSSPTGFFGITTDGAGELFIQTNQSLVKITPDGQGSLVPTDFGTGPHFEGEGRNVAGACAGNLFFTPISYPGSGQSGEEHTLMEYIGDTGQIAPVFNGLTISSDLGDMDFIAYDRFHSILLTWTDDTHGKVFALPVLCGGIDVEAHMVTAPGQTLSGFSAAPTRTISHADGTTEYVWDLQTVNTVGQDLQFGTTLSGLKIGETRNDVQSAYLLFKNSFVANSDITLPLTVPTVTVNPAVALTVSTDASSYPANTPVNVTIDLNNTLAADEGGILDVQVVDASGNLVSDIDTQTAIITANSSTTETAVWNTATYLNGAYSVTATLKDPSGTLLAQGSAPFAIGVTSTAGGSGALSVDVTTDKASYAPTDTVTIDDRLADPATNAIADGISFTTTVTNPDGSVRWTNTSTLAELVPGGLRDITFPLALANAAPGTYGVSVTASLNGSALAPATASFTVQSSANTGAGAAGTISVSPGQVPITSMASLTGSFTNDGNATLANATVTLAVLDPVAGQLVFKSPVNVTSLGVGQSVPAQADWIAAGNAGQTYVAILMVTVNGVSKTVAQANFKLVDPTTNLSGTLVVTPAQVQVTTDLNLAANVSNAGPAIPGVLATLSIQDPSGATVFSSPANLGALAQGQTDPVLATWLAAGPVNQTYTATLAVSVGTFSKALAQQAFQVIPPPIKIAASLAEGPHGRVLILTDDPAAYSGNQDPFGPNPAPGLTAQNQHLEQVLKAAGWSYTLVTNADDFATQFNTGGYEVYVILSEAVKLPTSLQESLDQAVANGAGLIVAGNHDDRNNKLEAALGVHSTGKNLSVTGVTLPSSALEQSGGQASFGIDGQPLSIDKATASVLGSFTLSDGTTAPAVFGNAYGTGKALYFAFDLALEQAQSPGSFLDQLLTDSLGYVHPATLTPYTGRVIPLVLSIQNQGEATPAVASLRLPTGVSVVDQNGAVVSGSTVSWILDLAVGESTTETVWIKLPATAGSVTVNGEVDSGTSPALTTQAEPSLVIGVQTKP